MATSTDQPTFSKRYRRYVLFILTGVYTFNFVDRQIITILQESIKNDLGLSDTQLGLISGFAFAIFYVTLGLPIARYADKNNRKNIVAISLAIWSAMTAVSGLATNFLQLALARIGVGIGEAGGSPPSHAIISDYYPPEKRATALSLYSTGIFIGIFLGFLVGGIVAQKYGWRSALYVLGIPGVLYAVIVYFTVKEPRRGMSDTVQTNTTENDMTLLEVVKFLFSKKTFVYLSLACGVHAFGLYGGGNWFPPFLERVHGLNIQEIGITLAFTAGFGGGIGTYLGGYIADAMRNKDIRWYLWISVIAANLNFIPFAYAVFGGNVKIVLAMTFFTNLFPALYFGPALAVTHSLVKAEMRAFASAVLFFVLNLIGLGLGPLVIGFLSDVLTPTYGDLSLRYAFILLFFTGTISAILFWLAGKHYEKDLLV